MAKKIRTETTLQRATDMALWLNFEHRIKGVNFKVIHCLDDHYLVTIPNRTIYNQQEFLDLPDDYSNMGYDHIRSIVSDENLHSHWEEIKGAFSTMDGELLRFILYYKVPLEKFIRFELASRGHDKDHKWVGFEKAEAVWLE